MKKNFAAHGLAITDLNLCAGVYLETNLRKAEQAEIYTNLNKFFENLRNKLICENPNFSNKIAKTPTF
jgi:hypothetical protein